MSYGLLVRNAAGTPVFDSTTALAGVVVDVVTGSGGPGFARSYPAFPGRSAYILNAHQNEDTSVSVDYALGYPRCTFPGGIPNTVSLFVFVE